MRSSLVVSGEAALAQQYVNLRHDARGGSFLLPHQQLGAIALPTNPTNSQTLTLTINGNAVVFTFVSAIGTAAGNVLIGASAAATAANLLALLNQPQTTTATGVALSGPNQTLVGYLSWSLSGTTISPSSNNTSLYAPLSSFTASMTATGASWTAQTMALYVEPGVVYVNGTRVIWSGGSSPTITAPSSHPRIDLLTIDNTGTLALTTGTENASPSAPTYPADKIVLCEIYNVVGETAIYDNENQTSGQGYLYHDVRPIIGQTWNPAALLDSLLPAASTGYNLGSASFPWDNGYFNNLLVNGATPALARFGGNGSDGALSISSGTTTINCSNAPVVIKNYSSISITGTGKLAFSNPATNGTVVILRSQGNVTLTSSSAPMIDVSAMGGAAGATNTAGTAGFSVFSTIPGGISGGSGGGGASGPGSQLWQLNFLYFRFFRLFTGAGGGGGQTASSGGAGGAAGAGGGGLLMRWHAQFHHLGRHFCCGSQREYRRQQRCQRRWWRWWWRRWRLLFHPLQLAHLG
jgi:hypothetical protein